MSRGEMGAFSVKTGVDFPFRVLFLPSFLGKTILIDDATSERPEIIMKNVFQKVGNPKKGIRKMKIPRKNVFLR